MQPCKVPIKHGAWAILTLSTYLKCNIYSALCRLGIALRMCEDQSVFMIKVLHWWWSQILYLLFLLFCKELLRGRYKRNNKSESFCFSIDQLNLTAAKVAKKEQVRTNAKNAFLKVFCPSQLRSLHRQRMTLFRGSRKCCVKCSFYGECRLWLRFCLSFSLPLSLWANVNKIPFCWGKTAVLTLD